MICFPSARDPDVYAFVIKPDSLSRYQQDLQRLGVGDQLYKCFTSTLIHAPDSWPHLLHVNNMFTVVVAKAHDSTHLPSKKDTCPNSQACQAKWSQLQDSNVIIIGSLQINPTEAYVWNICKSQTTCSSVIPYASHFVFDAVKQFLKGYGSYKRMSLNVDSSSDSYQAALKSYLAYGFIKSQDSPNGVPTMWRLIGAASRFTRLDYSQE